MGGYYVITRHAPGFYEVAVEVDEVFDQVLVLLRCLIQEKSQRYKMSSRPETRQDGRVFLAPFGKSEKRGEV